MIRLTLTIPLSLWTALHQIDVLPQRIKQHHKLFWIEAAIEELPDAITRRVHKQLASLTIRYSYLDDMLLCQISTVNKKREGGTYLHLLQSHVFKLARICSHTLAGQVLRPKIARLIEIPKRFVNNGSSILVVVEVLDPGEAGIMKELFKARFELLLKVCKSMPLVTPLGLSRQASTKDF